MAKSGNEAKGNFQKLTLLSLPKTIHICLVYKFKIVVTIGDFVSGIDKTNWTDASTSIVIQMPFARIESSVLMILIKFQLLSNICLNCVAMLLHSQSKWKKQATYENVLKRIELWPINKTEND